MTVPPAHLRSRLIDAIGRASHGAFRVERIWQDSTTLFFAIAPGKPFPLTLEVKRALAQAPSFRSIQGLAFSYRSEHKALPRPLLRALDQVIRAIAAILTEAAFDPSRDALPLEHGDIEEVFPTPHHLAYFESSSSLRTEVIDEYRRAGHVLVRRALDPSVLLSARPHLLATLKHHWPTGLPPVEERCDAYSQAFTPVCDIGFREPLIRIFTHSRRIAKMAAELMGVSGVRLFCDDWLTKEPRARITPWHQDEAVYPFEASETITCWIPLHDIREGEGLLRFARGSHRIGLAPIENINDISEEAFDRIIREHGFAIDDMPPVFLGDVSFHSGRVIHGAYPNFSDEPRYVVALYFFADGARLKEPTTPTMRLLYENAASGRSPGEPADSDRWPLVYREGSPSATAEIRPPNLLAAGGFHLHATMLPKGGPPSDIWIDRGRLRFRPVEGATELAPAGGFVLSGLVDCHAHISYPDDIDSPSSTVDWMNARREEQAATGVTLLRDMGAVSDAISSLVECWGLPRTQSAGLMILPYHEPPFTHTQPEELVDACVKRIERGAAWAKVFIDWTKDFRGRFDTGFSDNDEVAYPLDLLCKAVSEVHARGGRVAAHCFTRSGAAVAIAANVDSLEHGWGVDEELLREMADRGIAWVPLVGIATSMWAVARREQDAKRVAWIETTMTHLSELFPLAESLGVRVLAGTDHFPEVTVVDEITQLAELGFSPAAALAAGSWAAREWLGELGLEAGAPADLVLYRDDPRKDLEALYRPELVLIGGKRIEPSFAHVRPRFRSWKRRHAS